VRLGRFRRDLFFRLSVLKLNLLPLRQRSEDIPLIVDDLLDKYAKGLKKIPPNLIQKLRFYNWPGNIRELDSLIKTYVILLGGAAVDEALLIELLAEFKKDHCVILPQEHGCIYREPPSHLAKPLKDRVAYYEKFVIENSLEYYNKKQAARRLGISHNTLWRKLNAAAAID
jgi:transcriptional regulator with PAS, ATPase and Fis domain